MIKGIVSRDDHVYECFPDLAKCPDGTLVCIYRESMGHGPHPFSRLVCRRSLDDGQTWLPKQIIDECVDSEEIIEPDRSWMSEDEINGYRETKNRITSPERIGATINCPRILSLSDGQLLIVADVYIYANKNWKFHKFHKLFYRSFDNGKTWSAPEEPELPNGSDLSLTELRDGRLLLGLTIYLAGCFAFLNENPKFDSSQIVLYSNDKGKTWSKPIEIPYLEADSDYALFSRKIHNESYGGKIRSAFGEGSFVELDDGTILGILRDGRFGRAYKVLSHDGGFTWKGPFPTELIGLNGRPKAGLLASGEICITYRCEIPNEMLALHLLTQEAAKIEGALPMVERQPMPEDKKGAHDGDQPWHMKMYYPGRTLILDVDRSVHRDGFYPGWVQLDSGDIYVVDYINDDAPLAHIRSYVVSRSDIILFPEGDLPCLAPAGQPFLKMTYGMAARQHLKNHNRKKKK